MLTITGGNDLPPQSTYQGRYEYREDGIALVDDCAGPAKVVPYERPRQT